MSPPATAHTIIHFDVADKSQAEAYRIVRNVLKIRGVLFKVYNSQSEIVLDGLHIRVLRDQVSGTHETYHVAFGEFGHYILDVFAIKVVLIWFFQIKRRGQIVVVSSESNAAK